MWRSDEMARLLSVEQPSVWVGRTNRVATLHSTLLIVECADNNTIHITLCIVSHLCVVSCTIERVLQSLCVRADAERTYNYGVCLQSLTAYHADILAANGNILGWCLIGWLLCRLLQWSNDGSLLSCWILWLALLLCLSLLVSLTISTFF